MSARHCPAIRLARKEVGVAAGLCRDITNITKHVETAETITEDDVAPSITQPTYETEALEAGIAYADAAIRKLNTVKETLIRRHGYLTRTDPELHVKLTTTNSARG